MAAAVKGTPLDWSALVSGWAATRAADLRRHAAKVRKAYTRPAIVARMEPYAAALERAAAELEAESQRIAAIEVVEPRHG
jgi:hypothetical protein